jgi:hypothetical protein
LRVLENFPAGKHDDEEDGLSGAHGMLCKPTGAFDNETLAGASSGSPSDLFSGCPEITAADLPPSW